MNPEIGARKSITALLGVHWSEEIQAAHDRRIARRNALGRDLIFRDLGIQARKRFELQERIAGRWL